MFSMYASKILCQAFVISKKMFFALIYLTVMTQTTTITPQGAFDLLHQNQYFNGWPTLKTDDKTIVMAFPIEGWSGSAAVTLTQTAADKLEIAVYGTGDKDAALKQALASMSLDEDGIGWESIGKSDTFITGLQQKYKYMRPTLFHGPYEAAAAFIIGHRITIAQARKIRSRLAEEYGEKITVAGEDFFAFPAPEILSGVNEIKGLNDTKIARLHTVAQAAIDGMLDRAHLRSIPEDQALKELETLPGVGPFFSQGILYRGTGIKDGITHDDMTIYAIKTAYNLPEEASEESVFAIAKKWSPYRMWVIVLLHVWLRKTNNYPKKTFTKR